MKKINIIKENYEFDNIIHSSKYIKNDLYIIYYKEAKEKYYRFGISVGKKFSLKAVIRNKYKRRIKSIIDNNKNFYSKNKDYIIILKRGCLESTYQQMEESFINIMKQIDNKGDRNEKK